jgi:hypothetical protein
MQRHKISRVQQAHQILLDRLGFHCLALLRLRSSVRFGSGAPKTPRDHRLEGLFLVDLLVGRNGPQRDLNFVGDAPGLNQWVFDAEIRELNFEGGVKGQHVAFHIHVAGDFVFLGQAHGGRRADDFGDAIERQCPGDSVVIATDAFNSSRGEANFWVFLEVEPVGAFHVFVAQGYAGGEAAPVDVNGGRTRFGGAIEVDRTGDFVSANGDVFDVGDGLSPGNVQIVGWDDAPSFVRGAHRK